MRKELKNKKNISQQKHKSYIESKWAPIPGLMECAFGIR